MTDFWFGRLYRELCEEENTIVVLERSRSQASETVKGLAKYGEPEALHWKKGDESFPYDDMWKLYALSRVSDVLTLPFQALRIDETDWHPAITLEQRTAYWLSLGMKPFAQPSFHPFYHEIVDVVQSENPADPITVIEEIWPGFMLGQMMICRAGVTVRGGRDHIIKEIAENSTLYFASWRRNRRREDLSDGWGHNSQWTTPFRRDYRVDETFYYNVDGKWDAPQPVPPSEPDWDDSDAELSEAERIELLTHRCFIRTNKPDKDLWPYDDFYIEKRRE